MANTMFAGPLSSDRIIDICVGAGLRRRSIPPSEEEFLHMTEMGNGPAAYAGLLNITAKKVKSLRSGPFFRYWAETELEVYWAKVAKKYVPDVNWTDLASLIHKHAKEWLDENCVPVVFREVTIEYVEDGAIPRGLQHDGIIDLDNLNHLGFYHDFIRDMH